MKSLRKFDYKTFCASIIIYGMYLNNIGKIIQKKEEEL